MVVECSDGQKQTTLPHWEHRLAKNVEREVFLSGKGASPSIRNKCGLLRYKDENVPEIITVRLCNLDKMLVRVRTDNSRFNREYKFG